MYSKILNLLVTLLIVEESFASCSSEEQDLFNVAEKEGLEIAIAEASQKFENDVQRSLLGRRATAPRKEANGDTNIKLRDSEFIYAGSSRITVKNVAVTAISPLYLSHFKPDIQNRIADVSTYWSQIALAATYENSDNPNITSKLIVTYNGVVLQGMAGLRLNDAHFEVSNFKLDATLRSINFWNVTSSNVYVEVDRFRSHLAASQIFSSYYELEIRSLQEKILKGTINDLLQNYQVSDIFRQSPQVQRYFRSLAGHRDDSINQLVDLILFIYRQHLIQEEKTYISGPELKTTFEETIFGVPVLGTITANNGFIGDLSTVYRTGSFSLDGSLTDSEFTLFGSLGLSNLNVKYNRFKVDVMTFHPTGSLSASVASNSIYFEVTANLQGLKLLTIKSYDIRVDELENIDAQLKGMDDALNWLLSKILNWTIDRFKPKLVAAVQENIRRLIDEQLDKMGWQIPLSM